MLRRHYYRTSASPSQDTFQPHIPLPTTYILVLTFESAAHLIHVAVANTHIASCAFATLGLNHGLERPNPYVRRRAVFTEWTKARPDIRAAGPESGSSRDIHITEDALCSDWQCSHIITRYVSQYPSTNTNKPLTKAPSHTS